MTTAFTRAVRVWCKLAPARWLVVASLFASLLIPVLNPGTAQAAGEVFWWEGNNVKGTKGLLVGTVTFTAVAAPSDTRTYLYNGNFQSTPNGGGGDPCTARYRITVNVSNPGDPPQNQGSGDMDRIGSCGPELPERIFFASGPPADAPTTPTTPGGGTTEGEESDAGLCDNSDLGWVVCPFIEMVAAGAVGLDELILDMIKVDTEPIFNPNNESEFGPSERGFRTAWSIFRNIAFAIAIIIGLIMVLSQIMGLDVFDAYTIRKMLPKLVIAVIAIPLLWPLLQFFFGASNDGAEAIMDLIRAPFSSITLEPGVGDIGFGVLLSGLLEGGAAAGVAYLAFLGPGGILALIATVLLAVFSAFILLAARDVLVYLLIIISPLAVILSAYEPFKKVFTLWRTLLITILLSIPAVAAVLAMGKVGAKIAYVAGSPFTAVLILIAVYVLFWKVFTAINAATAYIGNFMGNASGGLRKGLAGVRQNALKNRWNAAVEGRREIAGANWAAGLGRRVRLADEAGLGAFGIGRRGRAKYAEAVRTMKARTVAGMMDQDKDRAGGDDDAMMLLRQRGMTEDRFIQEYSAMAMRGDPTLTQDAAEARARSAIGLAQSSLGARVGTSAMRIAAQRALLKSNTSYRRNAAGEEMTFEEMTRTMYDDVAELVRDGEITAADGGAMIKANGARLDRSGVGFGTAIARVDQVARGQALTTGQIREMSEEVLTGAGPGQLVAQRHETVRMMAPEMLRRLGDAYRADGNAIGPQFIQQIAITAGRRDVMAQIAPLNAGLLAEGLEGQEIAGRTVSEWEEALRDNPVFQEYRREYASRAAAAGAAAAAAGTGGPAAPGGGGGLPGGGVLGG